MAELARGLLNQFQDPGPSWSLIAAAFGVLVPISLVMIVFAVVSERLSPFGRAIARTRRERRLLELSAKPRLARALLKFARAWLALILLLNVAAICGAFVRTGGIRSGAWEVVQMYNLFNVGTYVINAVLIAPAAIAYFCAQKLSADTTAQAFRNRDRDRAQQR